MKKFLLRKIILGEGKERRAFTLIEVLIAVLVLTVVIGAAVAVEQANLHSTVINKHKLQAVGLAQEAINLTRSIRDTNVLADAANPWNGLDVPTVPTPNPTNLKDYYRLHWSGSRWELQQVSNTVAEDKITLNGVTYTRRIYITQ